MAGDSETYRLLAQILQEIRDLARKVQALNGKLEAVQMTVNSIQAARRR